MQVFVLRHKLRQQAVEVDSGGALVDTPANTGPATAVIAPGSGNRFVKLGGALALGGSWCA